MSRVLNSCRSRVPSPQPSRNTKLKTPMKSAIQPLKAATLSLCLAAGAILLPLAMTSCERDDTLKEKVDDALDRRPAEGLRDAGEDVKDAVKDAADDTKDAAKDATN